MKECYLSCCPQFHCTGGGCEHNCCIGWEIDVDDGALERYRTLPGPLGKRLRAAVELSPRPHFRLDGAGRCPMLGSDNLCDIQRTLGEEALCAICRDHPRYRVFLPGRTEVGLGLCCPEAVRLILSQKGPLTLIGPVEAAPPRETRELLLRREEFLSVTRDRRFPLAGRMKKLLLLSGAAPLRRPGRDWAAFFRSLEPLEPDWEELWADFGAGARDSRGFAAAMRGRETEYEQLLAYFLLRHLLADGGKGLPERAVFSVLSTAMLYALGREQWQRQGSFSFADQVELARRWSANIEYSRENMDAVLSLRR